MSVYKDNFNYLEFLKRRLFIGRIHPVYQNSQEPIIYGLQVPVETALTEVLRWSGQEMTRTEFLKYLRQNDVYIGDIDEFQKMKQKAKEQGLRTVEETKGKLTELADALEVSRTRIEGNRLAGKAGFISDDGSISVESRSKRHLSGITRRLGFLPKTDNGFRLDRTPTPEEAQAIRTVLGIKKRPSPSAVQKEGAPTEKVVS